VRRVPLADLALGEVTLDEEASHYVARVLRAARGDKIVLFDPARAVEGLAVLVGVDKRGVVCRVERIDPSAVRATREVTLLQAIGKGDKLDAVVRDATELGATRILAVETARTVHRLGDKGEARMARCRRVAVEAARQAGRGDVPIIEGPIAWREAIARGSSESALRICLWEEATAPMGPLLRAASSRVPVVLAVGPEGGFESAEIDQARAMGFAIASLGPFTLRTETVAAALLGAVLLQGQG
jgi:16S rRNA (uracil1498-N3)-methyltransferase